MEALWLPLQSLWTLWALLCRFCGLSSPRHCIIFKSLLRCHKYPKHTDNIKCLSSFVTNSQSKMILKLLRKFPHAPVLLCLQLPPKALIMISISLLILHALERPYNWSHNGCALFVPFLLAGKPRNLFISIPPCDSIPCEWTFVGTLWLISSCRQHIRGCCELSSISLFMKCPFKS